MLDLWKQLEKSHTLHNFNSNLLCLHIALTNNCVSLSFDYYDHRQLLHRGVHNFQNPVQDLCNIKNFNSKDCIAILQNLVKTKIILSYQGTMNLIDYIAIQTDFCLNCLLQDFVKLL